jgi:hypothetical protein
MGKDISKWFSGLIMGGSSDESVYLLNFQNHTPLGERPRPFNFLNSNLHMWYIKLQGFLTLSSMSVIVLTYDHSHYVWVCPKVQIGFFVLSHKIFDAESKYDCHFDV